MRGQDVERANFLVLRETVAVDAKEILMPGLYFVPVSGGEVFGLVILFAVKLRQRFEICRRR